MASVRGPVQCPQVSGSGTAAPVRLRRFAWAAGSQAVALSGRFAAARSPKGLWALAVWPGCGERPRRRPAGHGRKATG